VIAFCWREPDAEIYTAGVCMNCTGHDDERLAEMTQQAVFGDRVAILLSLEEAGDEMETMGFLETVGIDPVTGLKRRRRTAKGPEKLEEAKRLSKH
jgi:hypothetical protein